jgi:hypothetical protein
MRGIAEGSGYDIWGIRQLNMVPELGKASCSIFGAYGNASATNKLIHLRVKKTYFLKQNLFYKKKFFFF